MNIKKLPWYLRLVTDANGTEGTEGEAPVTGGASNNNETTTETGGEAGKKPERTVEDLTAEVERLRKENAASRTNAKTKAAEDAKASILADITKALGIEGEKPTIETVTSQLTEATTAKAQAEADAKNAQRLLTVFRQANGIADPQLLTDSLSFQQAIKDLEPTDFEGIKTAIKKAVEANPHFAAKPQAGSGYRVEHSGSGKERDINQVTLGNVTFPTK